MNNEDFQELINNKSIDGLIWKVANKYSIKGYTKEDIYQECITFLHSVIDEYDDEYAFSTFIVVVIENRIKNLIKESNRMRKVNYAQSGVILKDIHCNDWDFYVKKNKYSREELKALDNAYDIINKRKHGKLFNDYINGTPVNELSIRYQLHPTYIYKIIKDIKDELKVRKEK